MARKKATVSNETALVKVDGALQELYSSWGYSADDAAYLETARGHIIAEQRKGVLAVVEAGRLINTVRLEVPHGQWGEYVTTRLAMTEDTCERLRSAAKLIEKRPELLEFAQAITPTALYALARGRGSDDSVVDYVMDGLQGGVYSEVNVDTVSEAVSAVLPVKEKVEKPLPFKLAPPDIAAQELDRVVANGANIAKRGAMLGLDYDKCARDSRFVKWLKSDSGITAVNAAVYQWYLTLSANSDDEDSVINVE